MKKHFIGIDVSKKKLDLWLYQSNDHGVFSNDYEGFTRMLAWVKRMLSTDQSLVFCLEHTGKYDVPLSLFLQEKQLRYYKVSGLQVKRSMGIKRGKNDKVDAKDLARFAWLFNQELTPYKIPDPLLRNLKQLLAHRAKLVRHRAAHKTSVKENREVLGPEAFEPIQQSSKQIIAFLSLQIRQIEKTMTALLKQDTALTHSYKLLTSIQGVGPIIATTMIVETQNFTAFDNARKFACFAGIAPFEHTSGSSIRGKTRISNLGNRRIKTLLSSAASIAIVHNPELKAYYRRRLEEKKNKRSTLNVVRNKIVQRMFAVIKRGSPYVDLYKFAA